MRKLFTFLFAVVLTAGVFAQAPQKMSYQAVIRNAGNTLITSHAVGMRISILQGTTPVYVETQTPTTNANGLISIEVGSGTVVSGSFTAINWRTGTYSIKTETDPTGGTNYTSIVGTSQLLSVPYALNSKTADSLTGAQGTKLNGIATGAEVNVNPDWNATSGDGMILNKPAIPTATVISAGTNVTVTGTGTTANPYVINATTSTASVDTLFLGKQYLGGIIFYLYKDSTGTQHGLVVSKAEGGPIQLDGNGGISGNRTEDGAYNTSFLYTVAGTAPAWVNTNYSGWYIPSIDELNILWNNRFHVNKTARAIGSTLLSTTSTYWSSTIFSASTAYTLAFLTGAIVQTSRPTTTLYVRAVKSF